MKYLKKYHFLVYPNLFLLFFFGLKFLGFENTITRAVIAAGIGIILSPRVRKIQTQNGERKQLKWVFLKEPIFLD